MAAGCGHRLPLTVLSFRILHTLQCSLEVPSHGVTQWLCKAKRQGPGAGKEVAQRCSCSITPSTQTSSFLSPGSCAITLLHPHGRQDPDGHEAEAVPSSVGSLRPQRHAVQLGRFLPFLAA